MIVSSSTECKINNLQGSNKLNKTYCIQLVIENGHAGKQQNGSDVAKSPTDYA